MKKIWLFLSAVVLLVSGAAADQEISVIAKNFEFLPSRITVKQGENVKLYVVSIEGSHGIAISGLKVNKELDQDELAVIEFTPDKAGEFDIKCSVPCGSGHMGMKGKLIVVPVTGASKPVIKCPVTGDIIKDPSKAYSKTVYKGKTYYFCCPGCPEEFKKNPEKYLK